MLPLWFDGYPEPLDRPAEEPALVGFGDCQRGAGNRRYRHCVQLPWKAPHLQTSLAWALYAFPRPGECANGDGTYENGDPGQLP